MSAQNRHSSIPSRVASHLAGRGALPDALRATALTAALCAAGAAHADVLFSGTSTWSVYGPTVPAGQTIDVGRYLPDGPSFFGHLGIDSAAPALPVFDIAFGSDVTVQAGVASSGRFFIDGGQLNNAGTLNMNGLTTVGTTNLQAATVSFNNTGIVHLGAGSALAFRGFHWLVNGVGAQLTIDQGATMVGQGLLNTYGTVDNRGAIQFSDNGGIQVQAGTFNNHATGNIDQAGGLLVASGARFNNDGTVNQQQGAGLVFNSGTLNNNAGASFTAGSGFTNNAGAAINNAGTFIIQGAAGGAGTYSQSGGETRLVGGTLSQAHYNFSGGRIDGSGTITGPLTAGAGTTVRAGLAGVPGLLAFANKLSFAAGSGLTLDIGGLSRGSGYGAIDAGSIELDGVLAIALTGDAFMPAAGNTFDIIKVGTGGDIKGDFSSFALAALAPNLIWTHSIVTLADGSEVYELAVAAVPEPGTWVLMLSGLGFILLTGRRARLR